MNGSFHLPAVEESSLLHADGAFPCLILNLPGFPLLHLPIYLLSNKQSSV